MNPILNTWLLVGANVIGSMVLLQFIDLKEFVRETRRKLDRHLENHSLHNIHHSNSESD